MELKSTADILAHKEPLRHVCAGIYFLLKDDQIVYVGQSTTSVMTRIVSHLADKDFDSFAVFPTSPDDDLDMIEATYIYQYNPIYNSTMPPNDRYISKAMLKARLGISGHQVNRLLRKIQAQPRCGGYYDFEEIGPSL